MSGPSLLLFVIVLILVIVAGQLVLNCPCFDTTVGGGVIVDFTKGLGPF